MMEGGRGRGLLMKLLLVEVLTKAANCSDQVAASLEIFGDDDGGVDCRR